MADTEYVINGLRSQMRDLQSVVNYLESREAVAGEDYAYISGRLRELVAQLRTLEQFSSARRSSTQRAGWLN